MRTIKTVLCLSLLVFLSGCPADDRARRLGSVNEVKTTVAKTQYDAATTDADKVKVADEYFRNAVDIARTLNDYLQGRKPAELAPAVAPVPNK